MYVVSRVSQASQPSSSVAMTANNGRVPRNRWWPFWGVRLIVVGRGSAAEVRVAFSTFEGLGLLVALGFRAAGFGRSSCGAGSGVLSAGGFGALGAWVVSGVVARAAAKTEVAALVRGSGGVSVPVSSGTPASVATIAAVTGAGGAVGVQSALGGESSSLALALALAGSAVRGGSG